MRKIKVRAWDTQNHFWIYLTLKDFCINPYSKTNQIIYNNYEHWGQYTEIKDEIEKEIYPGDIVIYRLKHEKIKDVLWKKIGIVQYIHGCPRISDHLLYDLSEFKLKIIGNIYENPEKINKGGDNANS